jgi:hypothetical protein
MVILKLKTTISMNNVIAGKNILSMSSDVSGVTCNDLEEDKSISLLSSSSFSSNRKSVPTRDYEALTGK